MLGNVNIVGYHLRLGIDGVEISAGVDVPYTYGAVGRAAARRQYAAAPRTPR